MDYGFPRHRGGPQCPLEPGDGRSHGRQPGQPVDAHAIQPFYAGLLARDCGLTLSAASEGEAVVLTAARA